MTPLGTGRAICALYDELMKIKQAWLLKWGAEQLRKDYEQVGGKHGT